MDDSLKKVSLKEFVKDHSEIFALALGLLIFYKFADATNPAVKSFLWLSSSIIVILLIIYLVFASFSGNNSTIVMFVLGLPLFLLDLALTLQFVISLFEPDNIYSLNVVNSFFTTAFWVKVLFSSAFLLSIIFLFSLIRLAMNKEVRYS